MTDYKELGQIPGFWGAVGEDGMLVTEPQESWLPFLSTQAHRGYQHKANYVALE